MALQTFTAGQVLTAAQVTALQTNDFNQSVSTKTASHVLVAADKGTRVEMNAAGATTITVNTSLFNAGDTLFIQNIGAGICTVTAGTATVSTSGDLALVQNAGGTLFFVSAGVAIFYATGVTAVAAPSAMTTIATGTFTSVSALNLSNVFSDTFDFYELLITAKRNTGAGQIFAKFRENTTDFSSGYFGSSTTNNNATEANAGAFNANNSGQMRIANFSTTINTNINIKITRNDATSGQLAYTAMDAPNNLTTMGGSRGAGMTNFNGISIFPDANTFTGRFVLVGIK